MSYVQLRAFHAVARWGGFSRAAGRLGVSQPAISDQVLRLEAAYGVELFRRKPRKVAPTELGRELFALTERLFEAETAALELLSRAQRVSEGALVIGADAAVHALPLVARLRDRHPRLSIKVEAGNSTRLIERLIGFEIDFAVVAEKPVGDRFTVRLLSESRLVAFVARGSPLGRKRRIEFADLAGAPLVLREEGSATRALVEAEFARRELSPWPVLEVEGREAAFEAAVRGLGVGLVSEAEFAGDDRLRLLEVSDWQAPMREWLICLSSRAGLKLFQALLAEVSEQG